MTRPSVIFSAVLAVCALAVAACASGGATPATAPPATPSRCETPSADLISLIEDRLTVNGGGRLLYAQAVRAGDYDKVWMVAGELDGAGMTGLGEIALWATNRIDGSGRVLAVDPLAKEFSEFVDGAATDAHTSMNDDGAIQAQYCVLDLENASSP